MYLTFDAEVYIPLRTDRNYRMQQERIWSQVLDILKINRVRATHFVTGEFAQAFPDLVRRMAEDGHEVGSHTVTHAGYARLGPDQFEREVNESRTLLSNLTGTVVQGFRAPFGQVPPDLAVILARAGYTYDSSLAATHIPGHFEGLFSPKHPYQASRAEIRKAELGGPIVEIPVSVSPIIPLPYGGIFLSALAPLAIKMPRASSGTRVMFLHPYDFMDLKGFPEAYLWDKLKFTRNDWALLRNFAATRRNQDATLSMLIARTGFSKADG